MNTRTFAVVLLLATVAVLGAWADGGGGTFLGYTLGRQDVPDTVRIPSSGADLMYFGGYGYGVGRWGAMNGGFGFAMLGQDGNRYAGGVGGFIAGIRVLRVPFHVALVSWTGVGGMATPVGGYFVGFEEVDLELGLPIVRWFMPTVYVGYQVVGNLIPGRPFGESITYNPVLGVRISWGDFR